MWPLWRGLVVSLLLVLTAASSARHSTEFAHRRKALETSFNFLKKHPGEGVPDRVFKKTRELVGVAKKPDTAAIIELIDIAPRYPKRWLISWLLQHGDVAGNRPRLKLMLRKMAEKQLGVRSYEEGDDWIVEVLLKEPDESVVELLSWTLLHEDSNREIRRAIFERLATTNSPVALNALRKASYGGRYLTPLSLFFRPPWPRQNWEGLPDTYDTGTGRWRLATWRGFGSDEELWMARHEKGQWVKPLFIGETTRARDRYLGFSTPEGDAREAQLKNLIQRHGWTSRLTDVESLERDSDRDGYTDVAEKWLGLDPMNRDSDGDTVPDSLDKNPLFADRKETAQDKILRAMFDALTFASSDRFMNAFITFPPGVPPVEMRTWRGLVLPGPEQPETRDPSPQLRGIHFTFGRGYGSEQRQKLRFSHDSKLAEIDVHIDRGWQIQSYRVIVRNIGDHWYPHEVRLLASAQQ